MRRSGDRDPPGVPVGLSAALTKRHLDQHSVELSLLVNN